MKNFILKSTLFIFLFSSINSNAQVEEIILTNPSFEDFARPGKTPRKWYDCGNINFPLETPPDIHPVEMVNGKPLYGVTQQPNHGDTFLGMVIRETGSYESISQRLKSKLLIGNIYSFSLSLCTSSVYKSAIRNGNDFVEVNFTTPVFLRIWGGKEFCNKKELLAQSPLIYNTEWEDFIFYLEPINDDLSYLTLEVASDELVNGNLLIDNASSILREKMDSIERANVLLRKEQIIKRIKIQRLAEKNILLNGKSLKFKDNKLTVSAEEKIRLIVKAFGNFPNSKLIFDFNGLRKKKAKPRAEAIVNILLEENLSKTLFEIRNSKKEDNKVRWIVEGKKMFIGIMKIE